MAEEKKSYITQEERDRLGVETVGTPCYPVEPSDIRKWAIAVYWPEKPPPLFWDEAHAKNTKWGGIIAPQEFNPFGWPPERPQHWLSAMGTGEPGTRILNGGLEIEYFAPIRPGDVLTPASKLAEVYEREGRLGLMKFVVSQTDWKNQKGELVKTGKNTLIFY